MPDRGHEAPVEAGHPPRVTVVFDTVIFVRCLINPFGLWGRLVFDYADRYVLCLSPAILLEILEVLDRPSLARKFRTLDRRDKRHAIDLLARAAIVHDAAIAPLCRDPKDDKFLATAATAGADYLVSEDADLLVLGEYQGTTIVNAARFTALLDEGAGHQSVASG